MPIRKYPKNRSGETLNSCSRKNRRSHRNPSSSAFWEKLKMFEIKNGIIRKDDTGRNHDA